MGVKYYRAKSGKKIVLTELGNTVPKIRAKYDGTSVWKNQYKHSVPITWINEGWVKEVDDEGESIE